MHRLTIFLALALCMGGAANTRKYSGPNCLGSFCIDHNVPARTLFKQLGSPVPRASLLSPYCYQSQDGKVFLYVETFDSEPDITAEVFLSDFPNCIHARKKPTPDNLGAWMTGEGVRLGSPEADVRRAYGKPSEEIKIDSKIYQVRIREHRNEDKLPQLGEIAEKLMFYNGDTSDDLSAAEFGIRGGKVSYIWLSHNE
jgi:hypothetical protein